jgi:hypothetical protein
MLGFAVAFTLLTLTTYQPAKDTTARTERPANR